MPANIVQRAKQLGTPLIDERLVTFVYQGKTAPRLIADFNGWEQGGVDLSPAGKGTWTAQVELPENGYYEYAYLLGDERVPDPFNPRKISNGMGKFNHYFSTPGWQPAAELTARRGVRRGTVVSEMLEAGPFVVGGKRRVHFYQPPTDQPCPLLVVWDGQDYYRRALLPRIVDNLIHDGRIAPLALAMVEHGRQARMVEYGCCEITVGFVLGHVLERANQYCRLIDPRDQPGAYGVLGASMGGLMALYTGLRAPQVFGRVLAQSGAFSFGPNDMVVWELARAVDPSALKIWLDVGQFEGLLDCNRRMAALLQERSFEYAYREYAGGHNYTCWRNELVEGLLYAFGL